MSNTIDVSGTYYIRYNNTSGYMEWSTDLINYNPTNDTINIITPEDGPITIKIISDIQINPTNNVYFILNANSNTITIDGQNHTFYINDITDGYAGLFQYGNGTSVTSITIQNLHVDGTTSTLNNNGTENSCGWVGQNNFTFGTFNNCSSKGPIVYRGGGILGSYAGNNNGNIIINNCYSSGDIDQGAGGIVGYHSGDNGSVTINNSYSTGKIGYNSTGNKQDAGGIFGSYCLAFANGDISGNNCYSTGEICGDYAGGIFGANTNVNNNDDNDQSKATNCYSTGNITGTGAGGIFGAFNSNLGGGLNKAINCYSTGNITGINAGGIFGNNSNSWDAQPCIATNCSFNGNLTQIAGTDTSTTSVNILALAGRLYI